MNALFRKILSIVIYLIALSIMVMGIKFLAKGGGTEKYICGIICILLSLCIAGTTCYIDRLVGIWNKRLDPREIPVEATVSEPAESALVYVVWKGNNSPEIGLVHLSLPTSNPHATPFFILQVLTDERGWSVRVTSIQPDIPPLVFQIGEEAHAFEHRFTVVQSRIEISDVLTAWDNDKPYRHFVFRQSNSVPT